MGTNDKHKHKRKGGRKEWSHELNLRCVPPAALFRDVWRIEDGADEEHINNTVKAFVEGIVEGIFGAIKDMRPDKADEDDFLAAQDEACARATAEAEAEVEARRKQMH